MRSGKYMIYSGRKKQRQIALTQASVRLYPAGQLALGSTGFTPSVDSDVVRRLHDVGDVSLRVSLKENQTGWIKGSVVSY